MGLFTGQVAMITGGSRGIGFAIAKRFLQEGGKVSICGLDKHRLAAAEEALIGYGEVAIYETDVRDYGLIRLMVEGTLSRFERIDYLINNAGRAWMGYFANQDLGSIDDLIRTNLSGTLYATHAVLPYMQAQRSGVIVNIASGAGETGFPGLATYCATKFGMVGFSQALAAELRASGITVHSVCPGAVATDMQAEVSGAKVGLDPDVVAEQVALLCAGRITHVPGECFEIYR